jgi:hypothetical protein
MRQGDSGVVDANGSLMLELKRTAYVRHDVRSGSTLVTKAREAHVPGQTKQTESLEIVAREDGVPTFVIDGRGRIIGYDVTARRWEPVN